MVEPFEVPVQAAGRLFFMPCPSAPELDSVLGALQNESVNVVLSLLTGAEINLLGVEDEAALCTARGMAFIRFPVPDFGLPEPADWAALIPAIMLRLKNGEGVAVHCRAGIGRSGMVVVCLLIACGATAKDAIETASRARGVSVPETAAQIAFVSAFAELPTDEFHANH